MNVNQPTNSMRPGMSGGRQFFVSGFDAIPMSLALMGRRHFEGGGTIGVPTISSWMPRLRG